MWIDLVFTVVLKHIFLSMLAFSSVWWCNILLHHHFFSFGPNSHFQEGNIQDDFKGVNCLNRACTSYQASQCELWKLSPLDFYRLNKILHRHLKCLFRYSFKLAGASFNNHVFSPFSCSFSLSHIPFAVDSWINGKTETSKST